MAPALTAAGKVMTRERGTGVERETVALQRRAGVVVEGEAAHVPAVAGVVEAWLGFLGNLAAENDNKVRC